MTEFKKVFICAERLFREKIFFINPTKFVVIGIDPVQFKVLVRICDGVSGTSVTLPDGQFGFFVQHFESSLTKKWFLDHILRCDATYHIEKNSCWFMQNTDLTRKVELSRHEAEKLIRIGPLIRFAMESRQADARKYKKVVDKYQILTKGMDASKTCELIMKSFLHESHKKSVEFHVLSEIICNTEYLYTMEYYKTFFDK